MAAVFEPASEIFHQGATTTQPCQPSRAAEDNAAEDIYLWEYKIYREPQPSPMTGQFDTGRACGTGGFRSGGLQHTES